MNYRHVFHAGNFADVHKHYVLMEILRYLLRKPQPILYLDTHAGSGRYDLTGAEATRGGEWTEGIGKLFSRSSVPEAFATYRELVRQAGAIRGKTLTVYPGSPHLALAVLRPEDRIVLVDANPIEAAKLADNTGRRRNLSVFCQDGYASIKALVPPKENRGLVFIDPPFESVDEFKTLSHALIEGVQKWPRGIFCAWYPIKQGAPTENFHERLRKSGLRRILCCELSVRSADSRLGLNGSGLVIFNPPWQLDEVMRRSLPQLHALLAAPDAGSTAVEWLVPE